MITIEKQDLLDLIHWARRYCDGRKTGAAHDFNKLYDRIRSKWVKQSDIADHTLMNKGEFWPYAQDGMYKKESESFNAISPKRKNLP